MKLNDKNFAVMIGGHLFTGEDIMKISVNGSSFEMVYGWCTGTDVEVTVRCKTKDVEFVSTPQIPILAHGGMCLFPDFGPEVVSPLGTMKKAFKEAIDEMGNTQGTIQVKLDVDGKNLAKLIKKHDHTGGD